MFPCLSSWATRKSGEAGTITTIDMRNPQLDQIKQRVINARIGPDISPNRASLINAAPTFR
jgi:hypothetical protein